MAVHAAEGNENYLQGTSVGLLSLLQVMQCIQRVAEPEQAAGIVWEDVQSLPERSNSGQMLLPALPHTPYV